MLIYIFVYSVQTHNRDRKFECLTCGGMYSSLMKLRLHENSTHATVTQPSATRKRPLQHDEGSANMSQTFDLVEDSLNGSAQTHRLRFATERYENYVSDLGAAVLTRAHELIEQLTRDANVKWYLTLSLVFHKASQPDVVTDPPVYFRTEPVASTSANPLMLQLKIALRRLWQEIDTYEENGPGWVVHSVPRAPKTQK